MENIAETQERVLISENEQGQESILAHGQRLCALVEPIKQVYKKMNLDPFDDKVFKSLVSGGVQAVQEQLITDVTARYEALNLRSQTMLDEILADAYASVEQLRRAVNALKLESQQNGVMGDKPFPVKLISINEAEEAVITKQAEEQAKEMCRIYLNGPEEVTLHNKLQAAADAINEVWKEVRGKNAIYRPTLMGVAGSRAFIITTLFEQEQGFLYLKPGIVSSIVQGYEANREQLN